VPRDGSSLVVADPGNIHIPRRDAGVPATEQTIDPGPTPVLLLAVNNRERGSNGTRRAYERQTALPTGDVLPNVRAVGKDDADLNVTPLHPHRMTSARIA
jgi:hypothetical protein